MYVGIDPGLKGAMALIDDQGRYLDVVDLPVMVRGKTKLKLNPAAMKQQLDQWKGEHGPVIGAVIEDVWAMPAQGASSGCSLGHSVGVCEGVLLGSMIPTLMIRPQEWKRHYKLNSDKELARSKAIALFPMAPLTYKKDADRGEALLMAKYGMEVAFAGYVRTSITTR